MQRFGQKNLPFHWTNSTYVENADGRVWSQRGRWLWAIGNAIIDNANILLGNAEIVHEVGLHGLRHSHDLLGKEAAPTQVAENTVRHMDDPHPSQKKQSQEQ